MEAALRTAADLLTGESQEAIEYTEIRGTEGFKEAVYKVAGMDVKVAVVSGLYNADALLQKVRAARPITSLSRSCAAPAAVSTAAASLCRAL